MYEILNRKNITFYQRNEAMNKIIIIRGGATGVPRGAAATPYYFQKRKTIKKRGENRENEGKIKKNHNDLNAVSKWVKTDKFLRG